MPNNADNMAMSIWFKRQMNYWDSLYADMKEELPDTEMIIFPDVPTCTYSVEGPLALIRPKIKCSPWWVFSWPWPKAGPTLVCIVHPRELPEILDAMKGKPFHDIVATDNIVSDLGRPIFPQAPLWGHSAQLGDLWFLSIKAVAVDLSRKRS